MQFSDGKVVAFEGPQRLEGGREMRSAFGILIQPRPHLVEGEFEATVERLRSSQSYILAGTGQGGGLNSVAGFRYGESLAWGKYLYLDDLATDKGVRSRGAGRELFAWVKAQAAEGGCAEIHLDAGTQAHGAHRFFLRERMDLVFFHFSRDLSTLGGPSVAGDAAVRVAESDEDLLKTAPVMLQLRPRIAPAEYLGRVRSLERTQGYRVAALWEGGKAVCVAGYRFGESLAWGKYLYLDDLATDAEGRSRGWGKRVMDWLVGRALERGCGQFHLDSGTQRHDAHRFYLRERMNITAFHFKAGLVPGGTA